MVDEKKILIVKKRWCMLEIFLVFILLSIVVYKILKWELICILTPFVAAPLNIVFFLLAFSVLINRTSEFIKLSKESKKNYILSNVLVLVLCITILFIPVDSFYEVIRFNLNKKRFTESAKRMLDYPSAFNVALPEEYKDLSRNGGEVRIVGTSDAKIILFYSYRGILDNYSVYAYVPSEKSYETLVNSEDWHQIVKITDVWYFCASI